MNINEFKIQIKILTFGNKKLSVNIFKQIQLIELVGYYNIIGYICLGDLNTRYLIAKTENDELIKMELKKSHVLVSNKHQYITDCFNEDIKSGKIQQLFI